MSFVDRCNRVRKSIPFAWWLIWDVLLAPFLIWGVVSLSWVFLLPLVLLAGSAFFDVNEAIVKWARR
jgi:hypothetical protein